MEEEIYVNFEQDISFKTGSFTTEKATCHQTKEKKLGCVIVLLGILCMLLLCSLIAVAAHHRSSMCLSVSDMTKMKAQLTMERDLLNASLSVQKQNKVALQCPPGWRMFEWSCYLVSKESKSWRQSQKDCKNRGARLVAVNSTEEQAFLSGLIQEHTMLWIGLSDSVKEGTWRWVSGDPLTLSFWRAQQPDNGGGIGQLGEEDCAHITTGTNSENNWNDLSCKTSLRWICETDLATK